MDARKEVPVWWRHLVDVDGLERELAQALPAVAVRLGRRRDAARPRLPARAVLEIHPDADAAAGDAASWSNRTAQAV